MTQDLNNGIENIEYNVLNLPKLITFANGGTIRYTYSATGEKLRAEYAMTSDSIIKRTDYCGNLIYEQGRPKMLLVDGGFVTFDGNNSNSNSSPTGGGLGGASYHYYLKDHLGNNRVVVGENDSIEQVNHYYPYGGLMAGSIGGDAQRYQYNGKELDRMHGLDANRGLLDDRDEQGVKRSEWQATYRENVLRSQLGMPLRTHYINLLDTNGRYIGGYGPYLLTPLNTPLLPAWYKH